MALTILTFIVVSTGFVLLYTAFVRASRQQLLNFLKYAAIGTVAGALTILTMLTLATLF